MVSEGRIISLSGGRYGVLTDGGEKVFCIARGIFRYSGEAPLVGDRVRLSEDGGAIDCIINRTNALIRPPVANVSTLFITFAAARPEPETLLCDKMTAIAVYNEITPVIVITKTDLSPSRARELEDIYLRCGFEVFPVSHCDKKTYEPLLAYIKNHSGGIFAFAGMSGVGKSTLVNSLFPLLAEQTGSISEKTGHGKQTTRAVTLFELASLTAGEVSGFIADTPGFSMLDFVNFDFMKNDDLPYVFPEFSKFSGMCRYRDCGHTKEEGCAIISAVENGEIPHSRHESFVTLRGELKNKTDYGKK